MSDMEVIEFLEDQEALMSRQEAEMYDHAANQNVLLKGLQCVGRTWNASCYDAEHWERPRHEIAGTADNFKASVTRYGTEGRANWLAARPPTPAPESGVTQTITQIVEVPADDSEAYESGFNAGLTEGRKIVAMLAPAPNGDRDEHHMTQLRTQLADAENAERRARAASVAITKENAQLVDINQALKAAYIKDVAANSARTQAWRNHADLVASHVGNVTTMIENLQAVLTNTKRLDQVDSRTLTNVQAETEKQLAEILHQLSREQRTTVAND